MAAEAAHGAEAASEAGLPQLDPSYFPGQLFWLVIFFTLLYLLLSRVFLPRLGGVIETRAKKIKGDIDSAVQANAQAQTALGAYDSAIASARANARGRMDEARAEAADMRTKQSAEAEAVLSERLNAAEQRLATQRAQGFAAAREAADDVARDIVAKLTGKTSAA